MSKTIQQLAQEACEVQDACNLMAVVNGMSRALVALRDLQGRGGVAMGSDALHKHPIARAWADKVASLTGIQGNFTNANFAHNECARLAEGAGASQTTNVPQIAS